MTPASNFIEQCLAGKKVEALEWLLGGSPTASRNLGEMETEASIALVKHLYELGAEKVFAVRIDQYGEGENTGHLIVQVPKDRYLREMLFSFEREHAESFGLDGTLDEGQRYLYFKLD